MLSSIIYSTITTHDSKEVNFYILDFGAETLTMFRNAPHVGDVILSTEKEKIENLFKMISKILEERKKIFVDYNGSYDFYINHGGKQIPMIIIVINNIEAFTETYNEYEELIGQLTRDCLKYGIVFIVSTNGTNTMRYRLRQNFKQNLVLQFNDASDYGTILSGVRKKEPSKVYGRGLISLDNIYEFQTAYAYKEEKLTEYIKIVCEKLNNICKYQAPAVPILPEVVTTSILSDAYTSLKDIPVGINKDTLEIEKIDIIENNFYIITGEDITSGTSFLTTWINYLSVPSQVNCIVIDGNSMLNKQEMTSVMYETGENIFTTLTTLINSENNMNICVITGLGTILKKLSMVDKGKLTAMLGEAKNTKYIIIDTIDNIKTLSYEAWFKTNTSLSEGIWLGNGIANQFTLKVTTNSRILRAEIEPNFGYVIKKGKAILVKFVTEP